MGAAGILTNVAVILVAAALWSELKEGGRASPARRTWLMIAAIFAVVSGLLNLFR